MKLLVLAQIPPPTHGQSLAIAALLAHLRTLPDTEIHHVNVALSQDSADIGRWRPGKMLATLRAGFTARRTLARHGPMPLYYVPAPAKRGALYRDWTLLALARPRASGLILHWHAVGLGAWLDTHATAAERRLTRKFLGDATLAIAQAEACRADAELLMPRRSLVIRNGVADPVPDFSIKKAFHSPCEVVFAGLGCRDKGLFDALEGVRLANAQEPGSFRFTAIGPFASAADERAFHLATTPLGTTARHLGFVSEVERNQHFRAADIFCFPSYYPHEGQPAVVLEALAHDLPIITTRWRGIAENLPTQHVHLVEPRSPEQISAALHATRRAKPPGGLLRAHYLAHCTRTQHHASIEAALRSL